MNGRALVTGAAGFVGRHMAHGLRQRHWRVYPLDSAWSRADDVRRAWDWGPECFGLPQVDLAVHCAAVVGGRTMIDGAPLELACHDLAIDAAFFDWCRRAQPRHVVYYSSSAAYPVSVQGVWPSAWDHSTRPPMAEEHIDPELPQLPDQTYGWVKLTGERLARELNEASARTSVHVLRPFSGYGEDQDLDYPFPAIAQRVARGDDPVVVWGDGTQVRDWVHIDDVVGATLAVVAADYREPVNICTGVATSFSDLAATMIVEGGREVFFRRNEVLPLGREVLPLRDKPTGVHYRVGDPSTMLQLYTPTVSVEQGAARAVAYAKEHRC